MNLPRMIFTFCFLCFAMAAVVVFDRAHQPSQPAVHDDADHANPPEWEAIFRFEVPDVLDVEMVCRDHSARCTTL